MKLPRDVSGDELAKRLRVFAYQVTRQSGSHLPFATNDQ
jgi:predicted RNA binding protein YcfA (HicA-like mRNA interferase family)